MTLARTIGWGLVGSATTMLVRNATRRAMHTEAGRSRLPQATRRHNRAGILLVAALAGATLAIADVLLEQSKRHAES